MSDLVLDACLHNQNYDRQCEPSRASWLFSMIEREGKRCRFADEILQALDGSADTWDLLQLFELAAEMARRGDENARAAIRDSALRLAETGENDGVDVDVWLALEPERAVVEVARCPRRSQTSGYQRFNPL